MTAAWTSALISGLSLAASTTTSIVSYNAQKHAEEDQKKAMEKAKREQEQADYEAEEQRLQALADASQGRIEANEYGVESNLAARYMDENNKRQAKAQQMLEEEENPFYILLDKDKEPIIQTDVYVPERLVPPFKHNYGNRITLLISKEGRILNWPDKPYFITFAKYGTVPQPIKTNKWYRAEKVIDYIKNQNLSTEEIEKIKNNI